MQRYFPITASAIALALALPVAIAAQTSSSVLYGTYYMLPHDHPDVNKGTTLGS